MFSSLRSPDRQAPGPAGAPSGTPGKSVPASLGRRIWRFVRGGDVSVSSVVVAAKPAEPDTRPWIGVDLDGTLALHAGWAGPRHIGAPVPAMLARVCRWLDAGHRVKIMTARASNPACIPPVRAWLVRVGLPHDLEITCTKDFLMIELWDDRAIQVCANRGEPVAGSVSRIPSASPAESAPASSDACATRSAKPHALSIPSFSPAPAAGDA